MSMLAEQNSKRTMDREMEKARRQVLLDKPKRGLHAGTEPPPEKRLKQVSLELCTDLFACL
jgi:hypothetical protein